MIECLSYRKKPGVVLQEGKQTTLSLLLKHALAYLSIQQTIAMVCNGHLMVLCIFRLSPCLQIS